MPESDGVISLITNSKILPYTVKGFCHIILTKILSNLSCIEQNSVVSISGDVLVSVLIRTSILTCYVIYGCITYHDVWPISTIGIAYIII